MLFYDSFCIYPCNCYVQFSVSVSVSVTIHSINYVYFFNNIVIQYANLSTAAFIGKTTNDAVSTVSITWYTVGNCTIKDIIDDKNEGILWLDCLGRYTGMS